MSQTLKVLQEKGLLLKRRDWLDKRVVHLKPTARGRRLVGQVIPSASVAAGIENLSVGARHESKNNIDYHDNNVQ